MTIAPTFSTGSDFVHLNPTKSEPGSPLITPFVNTDESSSDRSSRCRQIAETLSFLWSEAAQHVYTGLFALNSAVCGVLASKEIGDPTTEIAVATTSGIFAAFLFCKNLVCRDNPTGESPTGSPIV